MLTVGQILKRAREQAHATIDDIAQATKIRKEYLEKIERNEFTGFVSTTFVKGFIRSFANYLDLDPDNLVALYRRQTGEDEKPIKDNLNKVTTSGFVFSPGHIITVGLSIFFVFIIGVLIVQFYRLQQPPAIEIASPTETPLRTDKQSIEIKGATEDQVILMLNGTQVQLRPDKTFSVLYELAAGENIITIEGWKANAEQKKTKKTLVITYSTGNPTTTNNNQTQITDNGEPTPFTITSTAEAWIKVVADKTQLAVGVVPKSYNRSFEAKTEFNVTTGKPRDTKLVLDGTEKDWSINNGVGSLTCTKKSTGWACE
jgi:cytoskeletal protein RodZ